MKCDRRLLSQYRDGDLSPKQRGAVEAHLKGCPECRGILLEYEKISRGIRALPRYEAPDSMKRELYGKVKSAPHRSRFPSGWGSPLRYGSLAAVALVLLLAAAALSRGAPLSQSISQVVGPTQEITYLQPANPLATARAPEATPTEKGVQKVAPPTIAPPSQTEDVKRQAKIEPPPVAVQPPPAASEATPSKTAPSVVAQVPVPVTIAAPPAKSEPSRAASPASTPEAPRPTESVPPTPTRESLPTQTQKPAGTPTPTPPSGGFSVATMEEVTRGVTTTATADCAVTPEKDFAQVYVENPDVRRRLGCAVGEERTIQMAEEWFENGIVLRRGDNRQIYVLSSKGTWKVYRDVFSDTDLALAPVLPPEGKFVPVRGIGKLWREDSTVRGALGWANEPERGYSGLVEEFEKGLMLWSDRKGTYVLDGEGAWQSHPQAPRETPTPTPTR